jgi:hypothetical protein
MRQTYKKNVNRKNREEEKWVENQAHDGDKLAICLSNFNS